MFRNNEPQEHASRNTEDAFLEVEFNVFGPKAFECNVEVVYQITDLLGFDNDIIDVSLDGWSNVFPKKRVACIVGT
jgi:hypothetical protein